MANQARVFNRKAVFGQLDLLAEKGYDWDRLGGLPVRPDAFHVARHGFLFDHEVGIDLGRFLPPTVVLNGDGTLTFVFSAGPGPNDGREVEVSVPCEGVVTTLKDFGDGETMILGEVRYARDATPDFSEVADAVGWLHETPGAP